VNVFLKLSVSLQGKAKKKIKGKIIMGKMIKKQKLSNIAVRNF
jgi:hypothetical protein